MTTVRFLGRVYPERSPGLLASQRFDLRYPDWDLTASIIIRFNNSAIEAVCELSHFEQSYFERLHLHVFHQIRACMDLFAFASGMGFGVILEQFVAEDGQTRVIQSEDSVLDGLFPFPAPETFHLVLGDFNISSILHMLTSTLQEPYVLPINCARAVEAIAHQIAPGEKDKNKRWKKMGEALHARKSYMEPISLLSHGPRHGELIQPPGAAQLEVRRKAWILMYRFLEYRKRGSLTSSDFPWL
jgi:hypothetical protein